MIKPAVIFHGIGKFSLACMTERRMAEIMRQRYRLSQIVIKSQLTADGTGNLRHFKRMGQPGAEIITFMIDKHLGFVLESPERGTVNDPVTVTLKSVAAVTFMMRGLVNYAAT